MTRGSHIKNILFGILAAILGVIALAIILVALLLITRRQIGVGPVYLLVPIVSFLGGFSTSFQMLFAIRAT